MSTADRAIPKACPSCSGWVGASYANHCPDTWCGWVVHTDVDCGVVIDTRSGRWMVPAKR